METKKCNGCLEIKSVNEFGKESRAKNGYKPRCKKCTNAYYREFYATSYREKKIKIEKKLYKENLETKKAAVREYYKKNKKQKSEYNKFYREKNRDALNKKTNEYIYNRRKEDPSFRVLIFLKDQVHRVLKSKKTERTHKILGYSKEDLINSLGRLPKSSEHIDHKIPISWFKIDTPASVVCNLSNLHIISKEENFKKNNKYSHSVNANYYKLCIQFIKPKYIKRVKKHD